MWKSRRPDRVRWIEVAAAGICGTDLHIVDEEFATEPPVTIGHELAGTVTQVGASVSDWHVGDRVTSETYFSTCGRCTHLPPRASQPVQRAPLHRLQGERRLRPLPARSGDQPAPRARLPGAEARRPHRTARLYRSGVTDTAGYAPATGSPSPGQDRSACSHCSWPSPAMPAPSSRRRRRPRPSRCWRASWGPWRRSTSRRKVTWHSP